MSEKEKQEHIAQMPPLDSSIQKGVDATIVSLGDWPSEKWWDQFGSSQLSFFVEQALQDNPSLQAVEQRLVFAKENAKIARSSLFPLLFFDMDENWSYTSKNGLYRKFNPKFPLHANLVNLGLSFTYEFDFWSKYRNLFQAAIGEQKAQQAEVCQAQLIIATSVCQTYFALYINLMREKLYEQLCAIRRAEVGVTELLKDKALLSKLPLLFSKERLGEAEKILFEIKDEVALNVHLLNILMGKGPDAPLDLDYKLASPPKILTVPKTLSLDLVARRPDLTAQIWRVEALSHLVGAAKADFFPNINLAALLGFQTTAYHTLFHAASKTAALLPAIHLPIFTAGSIRANVRAKKALFDEAVYQYNNLILTAAQEVADLLSIASDLWGQRQQQHQIVQEANERLELTLLRMQKGLDNVLQSYSLEEEVILKRLEDLQILYGQYVAAIKLIKALGGGYLSED